MKCVILAGGLGTRLSEETVLKPKPMVEIGGKPILWHVMKTYSRHGINDFVICLGYRGYMIKEYFANYGLNQSDVTIDFRTGTTHIHQNEAEPWSVTLVDTGVDSMTGGRIGRIKRFVGNETFCMTYGDGVSDVNISQLIEFHRKHGDWATLTAVQPPGRFGVVEFDRATGRVSAFQEKPRGDGGYINGGFFVLEPQIFDLIPSDATIWEQEPMRKMAELSKIHAFKHDGFWQAMDTLRDKAYLDNLCAAGKTPWLG